MIKKVMYLVCSLAILTALYLPLSYATDIWTGETSGRISTTRYSGGSTLTETFNPNKPFRLLTARLRFSESSTIAENFTMNLISANGSTYNSNLVLQDMDTLQEYVYDVSDKQHYYERGDAITLLWANSNTINYGVSIQYESIP